MSESASLFFGKLIPSLVREHPHLAGYASACIQVVVERPDGSVEPWCLDFRDPARWSVESRIDPDPSATIRMEERVLDELLAEPLDEWARAYGDGRLKIEGDLLGVIALKGFFALWRPSSATRLAVKLLGPERALSLAAKRTQAP
jgi:hypothetical protein